MRRDTLRVVAALPGQNIGPEFKPEEVEGTYRLVRRIYASVSEGGTGEELLPLEKRVSNTFQLE